MATTPPLAVEQCDRDAAAVSYVAPNPHRQMVLMSEIKKGLHDDWPLVRSFAHHRTEALARTGWGEAIEAAAKVAMFMPWNELDQYVSAAASAWCGAKDRETFIEDIQYFEANYKMSPGLMRFVYAAAIRALAPGEMK